MKSSGVCITIPPYHWFVDGVFNAPTDTIIRTFTMVTLVEVTDYIYSTWKERRYLKYKPGSKLDTTTITPTMKTKRTKLIQITISNGDHFNSFNPYSSNVTFLCPLKTSENLRFCDVFRGYRNVTLGEYGLRIHEWESIRKWSLTSDTLTTLILHFPIQSNVSSSSENTEWCMPKVSWLTLTLLLVLIIFRVVNVQKNCILGHF